MNTILRIDDDESLRDTIGLMLEQEGIARCSRPTANRYERAITAKPDLILVDLRLPGMSGIEIQNQLRAGNIRRRSSC